MALVPFLRSIVFLLTTLCALAVLGISIHLEVLVNGLSSSYLSFIAFGLGAGALTALSLPLFHVLGRAHHRSFTSTVVFEIVWFFLLWVLWVAVAGDTVVDRAFFFPGGCIYSDIPQTNSVCMEVSAIEGLAFVIFFAAFFYYGVLVLYALISAVRGKGIWTLSVREAAQGGMGTGVSVDMGQAQYVQQQQQQPYGVPYPGAPPPQAQPYAPAQPGFAYPGTPQQPQPYAAAAPAQPGAPSQSAYPLSGTPQQAAYSPPWAAQQSAYGPPGMPQQSAYAPSAYPPPGVYAPGPGQQPYAGAGTSPPPVQAHAPSGEYGQYGV